MAGKCPRQCIFRTPLATDVDQRSDDDSHHIIKKFVAFDFNQRDAFIAMRWTHLDAKDLSHRLGSSICRATEGSEVVFPDQGLSNGIQVRVVEPLHDTPGTTLQEWIAHEAVENGVAIHLARGQAARVESGSDARCAHDRNFVGQVLRQREHPTAESNVLIGVECDQLLTRVHARVR